MKHTYTEEEKEIHLTDNIRYARFFDAVTDENIVLMNWWKHIGIPSVEYMSGNELKK